MLFRSKTVLKSVVKQHKYVCYECNYYFRVRAKNRIRMVSDKEAFDGDNDALRGLCEGAAWLSSARAVRCRLKCHNELATKCYEAMDDDFNSPIVISHLFEGKALQGEIGEYIVQARRSGNDWFVGAMNGLQARAPA